MHSIFPVLLHYQPSAPGISNQGWPLCQPWTRVKATASLPCLTYTPRPFWLLTEKRSFSKLRRNKTSLLFQQQIGRWQRTEGRWQRGSNLWRSTIASENLGKNKKDANSSGGANSAGCQQTDTAHCSLPFCATSLPRTDKAKLIWVFSSPGTPDSKHALKYFFLPWEELGWVSLSEAFDTCLDTAEWRRTDTELTLC